MSENYANEQTNVSIKCYSNIYIYICLKFIQHCSQLCFTTDAKMPKELSLWKDIWMHIFWMKFFTPLEGCRILILKNWNFLHQYLRYVSLYYCVIC